ncbi:MAG: ABC transporter substrate-binding protein [Gammaproteobacteria bacterium]|nr:ABC transporter substrate-binding protein [Gammaproteobacteria bacterium]
MDNNRRYMDTTIRGIRHRRHALWLTATLLAAHVVWGATDVARELVVRTSQQVIEAIKKEPNVAERDPTHIYNLLNKIVVPHFDFDTMAKWVLARSWKDLDAQQRQRFVGEFRTLLVRTYAVSLAQYQDQKIQYLPVHAPADATDITVRTEVRQVGAPVVIPINYRMHLMNDDWKVYDVIVDGVSLIANYRTSFASEIRQGGIDKLIRRLSQHNNGAT